MVFEPIHQHFLMTAYTDKVLTSIPDAKTMLCHLVEAVGMVKVTEPQAVYINTLGNEGLTGSINLATSHIAFHIWDTDKKLVLDLYSCKPFEHSVVLNTLSLYVGDFIGIEGYMIDRDTYIMRKVI